ncbi:MAG: histidine kinase [Bacteroidales bacterium]|nr:histidine kinase [Bacteroidales bacterium]
MLKRICLLILSASVLLNANSQTPSFKQYTVKDGLPSSEVFHVIQDRQGYIWFATNFGVSKFDGYKFENYNTSNGLPENSTLEIYEDYKGRLWFISVSCKLSYYYNGKIYNYKYNEQLQKVFKETPNYVKLGFRINKKEHVFICVHYYGLIEITDKGIITKNDFGLYRSHILFPSIKETYIIAISYIFDSDSYLLRRKTRVVIKNNNIENKFTFYTPNEKNGNISSFSVENSDQIVYTISSQLCILEKNKIIKYFEFPSFITWLNKDYENNIWLSVYKNGLYFYRKGNFNNSPENYFPEKTVTTTLIDKEKGLWVTTLEDGAFYIPSHKIRNYFDENTSDNNVNCIFVEKNNSFKAGKDNGIIMSIEKNKLLFEQIPDKVKSNIYCLYNNKLNNKTWLGTSQYLYYIFNGKYKKITGVADTVLFWYINKNKVDKKTIPSYQPFYQIYNILFKRKFLYLGVNHGLVKVEDDVIIYDSYLCKDFELKTYSLSESKDGGIWLATINGLWKLYETGSGKQTKYKYINYGNKNKLLKNRINDVCEVNGLVFVGTDDYGVVILSDDSLKQQFLVSNGLTSNKITSLFYSKGILWAATLNGLNKIVLNTRKLNDSKIENYTTIKGLISNEINKVYVKDSNVYLATKGGITIFNYYKTTANNVPPPVYITKIRIMERDTSVGNKFNLTYKQNYINISFVGLSYRNAGKLMYKYKLEGIDNNWHYSTINSITYPFIPHGEYKFMVYASNEDGVWSIKPAVIDFIIAPPYWKTWWFRTIVVLAILIIISSIYIITIRNIKNRNKLEKNLNHFMFQALGKQMNPHFIFNSLNSINNFILKNEKLESSRYLSKFASLMRLILKNSQSQLVPINDEITAVKLYVELESLRFDDCFSFEVKIDEKINPEENKIPPLLIQPYVENAILHALMPKEGEKRLKLECSLKKVDEKEFILCSIEDNGIGREKASEIKRIKNIKHQSFGTAINKQRMDILYTIKKMNIEIKYTDLKDENGNASGTRVELLIPIVS